MERLSRRSLLAVVVFSLFVWFSGANGALGATGGPDAGGYIYVDSNGEPGGPIFDFIDISGSGTALGIGDEEVANDVPIGFTFTFYGNDYTEVDISDNGFLSFNTLEDGDYYFENDCPIPDEDDPNNAIYGFWDDLDPDSGGEIYVETRGDSPNRLFIVQYDDVPFYEDGGSVTFQIILFEGSNSIKVQYLNVEDSDRDMGDSATFGIENDDGTVALQYRGCNWESTPTVYDGLAILYTNTWADLYVQKFQIGPPIAGRAIDYEIDVWNTGPSVSENVILRDNLPQQVEFLGATLIYNGSPLPIAVEQSLNSLVAELGDIPPMAPGDVPYMVIVNVRIKPDATGLITNTAWVPQADTYDPDTDDNSDSVQETVETYADLSVEKTCPAKIVVGQQIRYVITATNNGPSDAQDVLITDTLPEEVAFENSTCGFEEDDGELTLDIGTLAAGESFSCEVYGLVDRDADVGSLITDTVNVGTETTPDPDDSNNEASCSTLLLGAGCDLEITKADDPDPVVAGETLEYTIVVTNAGPLDADNVLVTDYLPAGVSLVSTDPSTGSVLAGVPGDPAQPLLWASGFMPNGRTHTLRITVEVDPAVPDGTILWNGASVSSDTPEVDIGYFPNVVSEDTDVETSADLSITKTDSPDPVVAGKVITYTITVSNAGPSVADDVEVTDTLPPEVFFLAAVVQGGPGTCTYLTGPHQVFTALGDLAVGATRKIFIDVLVDPDTPPGDITNSAVVDSRTSDPNSANDVAEITTAVGSGADMAITKICTPVTAAVGDIVKFTLTVRNYGPSDAQNVQVIDTLPPQLVYQSDTGNCVLSPVGILTCLMGTMAAGEVRTFDIYARVATSTPPNTTVTNSAVVSGLSSLGDPKMSNNGAFADTFILVRYPDLVGVWKSMSSSHSGKWASGVLQLRNIGTDNAWWFSVYFYLSNDGVTKNKLILIYPIKVSMLSGTAYDVPFLYKSWFTKLSGKYVIAVLDAKKQVAEIDENNNLAVIKVP